MCEDKTDLGDPYMTKIFGGIVHKFQNRKRTWRERVGEFLFHQGILFGLSHKYPWSPIKYHWGIKCRFLGHKYEKYSTTYNIKTNETVSQNYRCRCSQTFEIPYEKTLPKTFIKPPLPH